MRGFFLDEANKYNAKCINIVKVVIIKKSDFIKALKKNKINDEKFCYLRDQMQENSSLHCERFCNLCHTSEHCISKCTMIHFTKNKSIVINKLNHTKK